MKAVQIKEFGGPEQLFIGDWDDPKVGPHDLLVMVKATALNRADTLQRMGKYPPPKGDSPIMGLEMAGEVVAVGEAVSRWKVGDQVCSLLGGGGYAELAVVHEDLAMPIPEGLQYEEAAAIPEVFLTAYQALIWLAKLEKDERILIHAGASGVGTAAIQLARQQGAIPIVTASAPKHELCLQLGAEKAIDYKSEDFAEAVMAHTKGEGVHVVLDFLAAPYFQRNMDVLQADGRMVILALMGGVKAEQVNMAPILRKRLHIMGSTLRARSLDYKIKLSRDLQQHLWSAFAAKQVQPVIDRIMDWRDVAEAHRLMEANKNAGKIILKVGS
ncbi:MAG: NAD(P)H-quinone oxidoreductase [Saprospiraceae bacterium]|nr:NAD(P)H-quinone oxidoreductase [Saprospiraceae bacterium]